MKQAALFPHYVVADKSGERRIVRDTSREAYREIAATGRMGDAQALACEALAKMGPMTAQELCRATGHPGLWKRMSELRRAGIIEERGTKICRVTGRSALIWALRVER